jgi:hypothetical protein
MAPGRRRGLRHRTPRLFGTRRGPIGTTQGPFGTRRLGRRMTATIFEGAAVLTRTGAIERRCVRFVRRTACFAFRGARLVRKGPRAETRPKRLERRGKRAERWGTGIMSHTTRVEPRGPAVLPRGPDVLPRRPEVLRRGPGFMPRPTRPNSHTISTTSRLYAIFSSTRCCPFRSTGHERRIAPGSRSIPRLVPRRTFGHHRARNTSNQGRPRSRAARPRIANPERNQSRTGGETGRRSGFRFRRREACGFKSRPVHSDAADTPDPGVPLRSPTVDASADPLGAPEGEAEPPSSNADAALAYALREATRAGEWAAVTAIANAFATRRVQP